MGPAGLPDQPLANESLSYGDASRISLHNHIVAESRCKAILLWPTLREIALDAWFALGSITTATADPHGSFALTIRPYPYLSPITGVQNSRPSAVER
jgi:hypothetical protein